jgi:hypothetical protein
LNKQNVVRVINEWLRRFIEHPEQYQREFEEVTKFLAETARGETPTYGDECAAYMQHLADELGITL